MKIYEFGENNKPVILLLPGTCCHWKAKIRADGTVIHCFYAVKMGEQYEARYRQHFADPDIIRHDLQHEELLVCYPQKWVREVEGCCGLLAGE